MVYVLFMFWFRFYPLQSTVCTDYGCRMYIQYVFHICIVRAIRLYL